MLGIYSPEPQAQGQARTCLFPPAGEVPGGLQLGPWTGHGLQRRPSSRVAESFSHRSQELLRRRGEPQRKRRQREGHPCERGVGSQLGQLDSLGPGPLETDMQAWLAMERGRVSSSHPGFRPREAGSVGSYRASRSLQLSFPSEPWGFPCQAKKLSKLSVTGGGNKPFENTWMLSTSLEVLGQEGDPRGQGLGILPLLLASGETQNLSGIFQRS